ncbi:inositol 2-dehydrogenase [Marinomonas mediterranea]|jgi:myo-inositol 2-dehydrogenase (EC 1.1.1.18)|uniref:Inositol 2-dehydrogenase n=1 Tax=Marinomonas mediterranea (strain ATCC 700492 / JCM 21426 / NBRC 103028 / MMB-1) TaxID=717774 RepID=F2K1G4_MARM1|nr:inositol 2-dehydrogenase [Marinomonas mediterranea]ADZ92194.1 Inositol 2-dehydrogenase [Marinomonas mediterranea MMB-1]WCN10155.1 inositol 2-dehydrogenase [Marinomonas mediterranea]WCN14200.1 inositol 2-dehydrogenase [Marinomonas mediterranea]WCN18256.1 inositol 2-dehydrogenase [Marinomonas mediterranea MMB-1]
MLNFALFGAGRIGKMHAKNIQSMAQANLKYVFDVYAPAAQDVAAANGAQAISTIDEVLNDSEVDAVLIATSTDTHVDLIIQAAKAGKAILCEKPIDLDTEIVNRCLDEIKECQVPIQIGFNRRYDPSHAAAAKAAQDGGLGKLEQVVITSRDPGMAPVEYLKSSGGIFRDMIIHDFDMARFVLNEEIVEVQAIGSALVDEKITEIGDVDSAMLIMKSESGKLVHVNGSRRASYGYDQRVEVFCEGGMAISNNQTATSLERYTKHTTQEKAPLHNFFIDRYEDAYNLQLISFIENVEAGTPVTPSFEDGRRAQMLADAAQKSLETGEKVVLAWS